MLIKAFKLIIIFLAYIVLIVSGFVGYGLHTKDKWDVLYRWAKR